MESFHYRSLSSQQTLWALWRGTRTTPWVLHEFFVANLKKIISVRQSQSQFFQSARICVPSRLFKLGVGTKARNVM